MQEILFLLFILFLTGCQSELFIIDFEITSPTEYQICKVDEFRLDKIIIDLIYKDGFFNKK